MKPSNRYIPFVLFGPALPALFSLLALSPHGLAADYEANLEKSFSVNSGGKLVLDVDRGSVTVNGESAGKVEVHVFRKIKGASKEKADETFKNHEVVLAQDGNTVSVTAKDKSRSRIVHFGEPNLQVRYEISIPKRFDVDLKTSGGNITAADLDGNAAARTSSGGIRLAHITGWVNASDSGGDISVDEAGGALTARTSSGSISVAKAKGKVEVSDSGGNIKVIEAGADVAASTSSGSITLANVTGSVEARDSGGDITIDSAAGAVSASTSSGSIHLGEAGGERVTLRDSGGNIEVISAAGTVSAETSSGSIKIKSAKGEITARDSGGDIFIGEAGGNVSAQTSSGSIRVDTVAGTSDLKNSGGNIAVQTAHGDASLSTSSGSIRIGHAGGKVDARNSGGSITVSEAQAAVLARTSSGEASVNFAAIPKSESRVEVSGGGVKIGLPRSAGLDIDARASGGNVVSTIPIATLVNGSPRQGSIQGKLNGGGPALILRSSSGDIRLTETSILKAEAEK
jgi:DUF4097 and DUF4098 domain-containing protein YvlB